MKYTARFPLNVIVCLFMTNSHLKHAIEDFFNCVICRYRTCGLWRRILNLSASRKMLLIQNKCNFSVHKKMSKAGMTLHSIVSPGIYMPLGHAMS